MKTHVKARKLLVERDGICCRPRFAASKIQVKFKFGKKQFFKRHETGTYFRLSRVGVFLFEIVKVTLVLNFERSSHG